MKITIQEIAKLAGVSRGAVDRAIHNRPGVKPEVRDRVMQVIEQTGYVPLHTATQFEYGSQKTVAVILPRLSNPFYSALKRGMERSNEIMKGEALTLEYYYYDEMDTVGILSILDFLEDHEIDACVIRGLNSHLLCERLNRLSERNIAVAFIDSDVSEATRLCFVSEDCYQSGRISASLLKKSIGSSGEIGLISSSPSITSQRRRTEGFEDAIRERWPNITIVERVYTQDQSVIAYERTSALLKQHPNLCGIVAFAGCAGEIGQAVLDQKRAGKVKIICYNMTQDVQALIQKGIVEFSISISPYRQGETIYRVIYNFLIHGKKPESNLIKMSIQIVFDENIEVLPEDFL